MTRRYFAALAAFGLFVSMVVAVATGFEGTTGCRAEWWWSHDWGNFLQPYVIAATLALAGASYFLIIAATGRRRIAIVVAVGAFVVGGIGIWFLGVFEALAECPP